MRKQIVKLFALDYICRVFGKTVNFVRAANIIFPLVCLTGVSTTLNSDLIFFSLLVPTLAAMFLGFYYFRINPVKWEELDKSQKWQYGRSHQAENLTKEQNEEWQTLNKEIFQLENKNFHNIKALLVNLIAFVAILLTIIL